jgi:hypothetical protein
VTADEPTYTLAEARAEDEQFQAIDDADVREIEDDLGPQDEAVWPCCTHCHSGVRPCSYSVTPHRSRCGCQPVLIFRSTTNVQAF